MGVGGIQAYWGRVHKRAFAATRRTLGLESWWQIVLRALAAIAVVSALALLGSADAAGDELIFRGAAIGVVLAIFPILYLVIFIATPAIFDKDQRESLKIFEERLNQLAAQLSQRESAKESVRALCILLERGQDLVIKKISEDEFKSWENMVDEWGVYTLRYLSTQFSQQEAVSFKYIQYQERTNFVFKINDDHNKRLNQLCTRIEKLKDIINRHKESWSPISSDERAELESKLDRFKAQALAANCD